MMSSRLVVVAAFLGGASWALLSQLGCLGMNCTCPALPDPPVLGTYVVETAPDPEAAGAILEVIPQYEGAETYRTLVLVYDAPEGRVQVSYDWPE